MARPINAWLTFETHTFPAEPFHDKINKTLQQGRMRVEREGDRQRETDGQKDRQKLVFESVLDRPVREKNGQKLSIKKQQQKSQKKSATSNFQTEWAG